MEKRRFYCWPHSRFKPSHKKGGITVDYKEYGSRGGEKALRKKLARGEYKGGGMDGPCRERGKPTKLIPHDPPSKPGGETLVMKKTGVCEKKGSEKITQRSQGGKSRAKVVQSGRGGGEETHLSITLGTGTKEARGSRLGQVKTSNLQSRWPRFNTTNEGEPLVRAKRGGGDHQDGK